MKISMCFFLNFHIHEFDFPPVQVPSKNKGRVLDDFCQKKKGKKRLLEDWQSERIQVEKKVERQTTTVRISK